MRCLQILAFWLSWVRAEYAVDNKLMLSPYILSQLRLWASKSETPDACDEEIELAKTLYEDFGRYEACPCDGDAIVIGGIKPQTFIDFCPPAVDEKTVSLVLDSDSVLARKETGNEFFKSKKYIEALEAYDTALELLGTLLTQSSTFRPI